MNKQVKTWADKANKVGILNVNKIESGGVSTYDIDCGGFAWCRMNSDDFAKLKTALNKNVTINM